MRFSRAGSSFRLAILPPYLSCFGSKKPPYCDQIAAHPIKIRIGINEKIPLPLENHGETGLPGHYNIPRKKP
jgi:hypothetical protein